MEILLRILGWLMSVVAFVVNTLLNWCMPRLKPTYPPIRNRLLLKSAGELVLEIRSKKLTSVELVGAYIERVKEVNGALNAVVEDRYEDALKEAVRADELIARTPPEQLATLFARYPLLGIPFTVKESCALKGMSHCVGSVLRLKEKAAQDGEAVAVMRAAGCIPLLVSANPEFCLSFETSSFTHGRCLNPYDMRRISGGSSGGEAALNGAGASLFGLASDIAGSIRLPALFCGVYGHKPTGGLIPVKGHFPYSLEDPNFGQYLQMGPISRFARDLPVLLQVMAGANAHKLKFDEGVITKDIKVFYSYGYSGINSLSHPTPAFDIRLSITRAVKCFAKGGLVTKEVDIKGLRNSIELSLTGITSLKGTPSIISNSAKNRPSTGFLFWEMARSLIGHSFYTKEALFIELMHTVQAFIPEAKLKQYRVQLAELKQELLDLLGSDGVLIFPSFHTSAPAFNTSILNLPSIDMLTIFNVLGFPSTQVPLGMNSRNMPVGFQVVAAPYQDKLTLQIAAELEGAFGGWESPQEHNLEG